MVKNITKNTRGADVLAPLVASGCAFGFLSILIFLHLVNPEYDPSWRFISEYALGTFGWSMNLAFLMWAGSYIALYVALKPRLQKSFASTSGLILLLVSAAGLILGGLFNTDPITGTEEQTIGGIIHSIGGTLGLAMPFAAVLIALATLKDPNWSTGRRVVIIATTIAFTGFLISFISLAILLSESGGKFGPGVWVGWPNRIEVTGYCVWLILIAQQVGKWRE